MKRHANTPKDPETELTRRQWVLRLGEMVALAGLSGLVPETALLVSAEEKAALPPGLYTPSADDLVHALGSAHHLTTPPPGSETDYALPAASPYRPQFFSAAEFEFVTRLVEIILGGIPPQALNETTQWIDLWFQSSAGVRAAALHLNPMHRALAVGYFGEDAVRELETSDPPAVARQGLAAWQQRAKEKNPARFLQLAPSEQAELVRAIASDQSNSPEKQFFELIRREAIHGYYTSADGLKELDYKGNAYYPYCPGCAAP